MEEMEKGIENEMMNNAAVKIQANFRGFKTRRELGVSKAKDKACEGATASASDHVSSQASINVPLSPDIVEELGAAAIASRGCADKPPLAQLRSLSYPGSHDLDASPVSTLLEFDEGEEDKILNPEPDIDLELGEDYINQAATKIQANYRGWKVRKSIKRPPSGKENNGEKGKFKTQKMSHEQKELGQLPQEAMQRLQEGNHDDDDETEEPPAESDKAATKIQASFKAFKERQKFHQKKKACITIQANIRGFLTRKRLSNMRRRSFQRRRSSAKSFQKELDDMKKVNEAATRIQAVFRGYQVRSKILPRSSSMIDEREQVTDE